MKKKHIYMLPERMCGSASVEVLAMTSCTKVIHALPEPKHLSLGVSIVRTLMLRANLGSSDIICWDFHFPKYQMSEFDDVVNKRKFKCALNPSSSTLYMQNNSKQFKNRPKPSRGYCFFEVPEFETSKVGNTTFRNSKFRKGQVGPIKTWKS